jgi:hypothetical protein
MGVGMTTQDRLLMVDRQVEKAIQLLTAPPESAPTDIEIRFDVYVSLRTALARAGVDPADIKDDWKPSDAGMDGGGWGMCLADFAVILRERGSSYGPYQHRPRFTEATRTKTLAKSELYLVEKVREAIG